MTEHYIEDKWRMPIQNMEVGDCITTKQRTITRTDVELGALLGGDYAAQFLSRGAAQAGGWKDQLLPGVCMLNIAYGLLIQAGFLADVVAYMGTDRLRFLAPVYSGDAIRMEAEVASKKKTEKGWVCEYDWKVLNKHDVVVANGHNI
jgi:monoamine oxidase